MSGHETIRVLEVEVDASLPTSAPDDKSEGRAAGQPEVGGTQDILTVPQITATVGKSKHCCSILVGRQVKTWESSCYAKNVTINHDNKSKI